MIDLGVILRWLRHRRETKHQEVFETTLLHLNELTVTIHGRLLLSQLCLDEDNDLPYEIKQMYWTLLKEAPIEDYAQWN